MFKILDWHNPFLNLNTLSLENYVLNLKDSLKTHREITAVKEDLDLYEYLKMNNCDPKKHHQIYFDELQEFLNIKKHVINLMNKHKIPTNVNDILIINNEKGTSIPWHADGHPELHKEIGAILVPLKKHKKDTKLYTYFNEDPENQLCFERHINDIVQIKTWPMRHKTGCYPDNYFYVRFPVTEQFNGF